MHLGDQIKDQKFAFFFTQTSGFGNYSWTRKCMWMYMWMYIVWTLQVANMDL